MLEFFTEWGYTIQSVYIVLYIVGFTSWMIWAYWKERKDEQVRDQLRRTKDD
jgi:hypothetical protein